MNQEQLQLLDTARDEYMAACVDMSVSEERLIELRQALIDLENALA